MENVILVIHLVLAICLIGIVLLQRSEGGGMGMGGGGGVATGRQGATAMTKLTWAFAAAFLTTSVVLTVLAAQNNAASSVLDVAPAPAAEAPEGALLPPGQSLLPPTTGDAPLTPPRLE